MPTNRAALRPSLPWLDASGHFSPLKAIVLAGCILPAVWMGNEFGSGRWDFPSPYVGLIYHSGLWATYFLLLSLLVTPLRRITGWGRIAQVRRMLGVTAFAYCLLHLVAWFGLRVWDWSALWAEQLARPTLWLATLALIVFFALALTSFDAAMRALGGSRWKRLHRLVYPAAMLAVLHFLLSPGSLQGTPFLMAGALFWLLGWRWLDAHRLGRSPLALSALGLAASVFALLLQPLWVITVQAERSGQTAWQALAGNLDGNVWLYLGIPPVFLLLAWTLVSAVTVALINRHTLPKPIFDRRSAS